MRLIRKPRIAVFDFCDSRSQTDVGCVLAARLAERLLACRHYLVIERSTWKEALGEEEISQECRFHAAWAAYAGALAAADAVVIGKIHHPLAGRNVIILAAMLDTASGETLARGEHTTVDGLASLFDSRRLADKVRIQKRSIRAEIRCVRGDATILNAGRGSGLLQKDRLQVDRILERVPDPYDPNRLNMLEYLTVTIGEAEVLYVGNCASLARYCGGCSPRAGDLGILVET